MYNINVYIYNLYIYIYVYKIYYVVYASGSKCSVNVHTYSCPHICNYMSKSKHKCVNVPNVHVYTKINLLSYRDVNICTYSQIHIKKGYVGR